MYEAPYELGSAIDGYPLRIRTRQIGADQPVESRHCVHPRAAPNVGVAGLLPSGVSTLEGQLRRVYAQYRRQPDDLAKNVFLANMRDRNEVLFYRLLADHLAEMLPIVYTPTVGKAIERFSHEFRRPRGVFLSVNHPEDVEESLRNYGLAMRMWTCWWRQTPKASLASATRSRRHRYRHRETGGLHCRGWAAPAPGNPSGARYGH